MATGFRLVNGSLYHFSESGSMSSGWFINDGAWYCSNASGEIRTGWFYNGSSWYLLDPNNNGAMLEGFQTVNGSIYYLDPDSGGALKCNTWSSHKMKTYIMRAAVVRLCFRASRTARVELSSGIPRESLSLAGIGPQLHRCGFTQTQMGFCSAVGDSLTVGGITSTTNPEHEYWLVPR